MDYFDDLHFVFHRVVPDYDDRGDQKGVSFNYYGLQYNHSGTLVFDGRKYPGSHWFLTEPGRVYNYGCVRGERRYHCFLCFNGARVGRMLRSGLIHSMPEPVPVHRPDTVLQEVRRIDALLGTPSFLNTAKAAHHLEGLFMLLLEDFECRNTLKPQLAGRLQQLIAEIREHPELEWNFAAIAREMSLSESHFRSCFHQFTSYAPNRFVIECRLNKAADLLLNQNLRISEIASLSGFNDSFYFSRVFRKYRGVSPRNFLRL